MRNMIRLSFRTILLSTGVIALFMGPAFADPACDAEAAEIRAVLDASDTGTSAENFEQANILYTDLSGACAAGATLDGDNAATALQIRALLGMGGVE
jgi:hypothetical protein